MCLYISKEHFKGYEGKFVPGEVPTPFIAKEHIPVYKILVKRRPMMVDPKPWFEVDDLVSPFLHMEYKPGTGYICIAEHFQPIRKAIFEYTAMEWVIEYGLHSYQTKEGANRTYYKMYIPKGAKYYFGQNGDLASERLMFPKDEIEYDWALNQRQYLDNMLDEQTHRAQFEIRPSYHPSFSTDLAFK